MTKRYTENNLVFIDTGAFKALIDEKDEFHTRVKNIWDRLRNNDSMLVTSNYILNESFTLIRKRCGINTVKNFRDYLAHSGMSIKIVRVMVDDEKNAWQWFVQPISDLSFTDCVSISMMERLGIKEVVSFDKHFRRFGCKVC